MNSFCNSVSGLEISKVNVHPKSVNNKHRIQIHLGNSLH